MRKWSLTLAGLAGAAAVWLLLPRYDTAVVEWKPRIGRQEAIEAAVRSAAAHGEQVGGWKFAVATEADRTRERARRVLPASAVAQSFEPLSVKVLAYDRRANAVLVTLDANGRPAGFVDRSRLGRRQMQAELPEQEFRSLAGAYADRYRRTAENVKTQEGLRNAWEWAESAGVVARVEVITRHGEVVRSTADYTVSGEALQAGGGPPGALRDVVILSSFGVAAALVLLAAWSLFRSLVRRTDQLRFGMRFVWMAAVTYGLNVVSGSYQNAALFVSFDQGLNGDTRLLQGLALGGALVVLTALVVAAGYAAAPRGEWPRWHGASLAAQGRLWTKPVGREIWDGLAGGVALAALPYLAAAAGAGRLVRFAEGANLLVERWPQLEPLDGLSGEWEMYAAVVFLLPWAAAKLKSRAARLAVVLAAGALLASEFRGAFPPGEPWRLAVGAALAAGFVLIYQQAGLLGVWVSPVGMLAAVEGVRLAHLAPPSVERGGWQIIGLYALAAAAALAARFFGQPAGAERFLEEMEENTQALPRSERERLKAEFQVARRAQAGMLPAAAPELERFEVSAVCEPAREVGGDLFDYLQFEDGQWGLCVADVSGKGVPAALYMTLTKGMLASAKLRQANLALIAGRLNQALTAAGKRRVFVTMSLVLLDEKSSTFRHVRAGHNPPVVWRAATGECEFLKPPGIGLGLTAGAAFERNLAEQRVELWPGDALVLYSDGLVECMNESHDQFGEERLAGALKEWGPLGAAELKDRIVAEARIFRGQADPHDDLTVMVVKARAAGQDAIG